MKVRTTGVQSRRAYTFMESTIGVAVVGIAFVALYAGFGGGLSTNQLSREDSRAIQILVDKMETFRTLTWDQLMDTDTLPTNFVATYSPTSGSQGWSYNGTVSVSPVSTGAAYSNDLRLITVNLSWQAQNIPRTRAMRTLVSKHGLSNYRYQ